MTRDNLQLTCCALIASACTLAAALVVTASQKNLPLLSNANAEMVVNAGNLQFLTTKTDSDVEALFVLDSNTSKLLVYKVDQGKKRIELVGLEDLKKRFGIKVGAAGDDDDKRPARAVR